MTEYKKRIGLLGLLILNFMSLFLIASIGVVGYSAAAEFNAIDKVGLIFALETCCRCTICPVSGKLGEKLGRKNLLIFALIIYTIGYAVVSIATSFTVILITRCVCGAAWGCWMVNSFLLFCDLFGQQEGPKYSGIAQTVGTVSILAAAPIAGVICASGWRLTYYIAVPIMILTTVLCAVGLPKSEKATTQTKMDIGGSIFCTIFLVPFSLAMSLGSSKGWGSPFMITMYVLSAVGLIGLIISEKKAADPILPIRILKNKYYLAIFIASFCFCIATSASQYVPTYLQMVCGTSSTLAGLATTPGSIICAILTSILGARAAKTGKYRNMVIWWCVFSLISGILMLFIGTSATDAIAFAFVVIAITPMGIGQAMQQIVPYTYPMMVLEPQDLAAGAAFMTFAGIFAGAIASGIFSALMNSPAGMVSMFKLPIFFFIVMAIFGIFVFRDVKAGETL